MTRTALAKLICMLFAVIACFGSAYAFDLSSCQDSTDRLRRAARDLADSASSLDERAAKRGDLQTITDGFDEVESRLNRAKNDCENTSLNLRICQRVQLIARQQGLAAARRLCDPAFERLYPGVCAACIPQ